MSNRNPPRMSGIDRLDADSKERSERIEKLLFTRGRDVLGPPNEVAIFVVTGDLTDGLLYGPVTNFSREALLESARRPAGSGSSRGDRPAQFLDRLREFFPLEAQGSAAGLLSRTANDLYLRSQASGVLEGDEGSAAAPTLALVLDSAEAVIKACLVAGTEEADWRGLVGGSLGEGVQSGLRSLRNSLEGLWHFCVCLRRGDGLKALTPKREVKPVVLGVVALKSLPDVAVPEAAVFVEAFKRAAAVSLLGTAALLLEKERYFQKALRQAVRGSIIKCGPSSELADQVFLLFERQDMDKPTVPSIEDGEVPDVATLGAWYRMCRFELPSLLDLFTTAAGFQDYEARAIVRACTRHLTDAYWGPAPAVENEVDLRNHVLVTLALTSHHVEACCESIAHQFDEIRRGRPVRVGKGVDVFMEDDEALERMAALVETMRSPEPQGFFLSVKWDASETGKPEHCSHPRQALGKLWQAAQKLRKLPSNGSWLVVQDGESPGEAGAGGHWRIHGDAHFGNFLVDASVPEDSLVVSIDPRILRYGEDDALRQKVKGQVAKAQVANRGTDVLSDQEIGVALARLGVDPLFDLAKLLLSTTCAYGLAYRNAFGPVSKTNSDHEPFVLRRPSRDIRKLSETGGISGGLLVRIQAPVADRAWDYHAGAVSVIELEWARWSGASASSLDEASRNAAFVCLWLLAVRHTFSIAEKLFPQYPERAFPMYLFGCRLLSRGHGVIGEVLRGQLVSEANVDFGNLWRLFELK